MEQKYAISVRTLSKVFITISVHHSFILKTIKSACPFNLTDLTIPIAIKIVQNLAQTRNLRAMSNM